MKVYAITDIGRMRPINEDSYYAPLEGERFCAVADGMGGHNAGEVASAMAVQVFSEEMRKTGDITAGALHTAVERANEAVYQKALENAGMSGMGTTFSALAEQGETAYLAHVGDSRIYLVRRGAIMQLTTDHTLVEEMVQKGLITPREARVHPKRNIITRALGTEERVQIDIVQMGTAPRRRLLPVQRRHDQLCGRAGDFAHGHVRAGVAGEAQAPGFHRAGKRRRRQHHGAVRRG